MTVQTALITGASSGIGRSTALALGKLGYRLVLIGRRRELLDAVAAEAKTLGSPEVHCLPIDLGAIDSLAANLATGLAPILATGPIDLLVNNAGMAYTGSLGEMPLADWQNLLNLNLTAVLLCTQAVLPVMRANQRGLVINIASIAAHSAFPDWGAYCMSKAGLVMFSKALAMEERGNGIRVSIVSPGSTRTGIWDTDTVKADFDRSQMLDPDVVAQTIVQVAQMPDNTVIDEVIINPSGGAF
jgi:short-subunit dehydrogenase